MDDVLNEIMEAKSELAEAEERLIKATAEVTKATKRFKFLHSTQHTNRILSAGFLGDAQDAFVKAVASKKAIEESIRNINKRLAKLHSNFAKAKKRHLKSEDGSEVP